MEYYFQQTQISDPLLKFIKFNCYEEGLNSQKMDFKRLRFFMEYRQ